MQDIAKHAAALNELSKLIHARNVEAGWWTDLETGKPKERDVLGLLMLVVTEIAEAAEGARKDLHDDHLPTRKMFEVEIADAMIRLFDIAGAHKLDLAGALTEKVIYNSVRSDHKPENRRKAGGKKF